MAKSKGWNPEIKRQKILDAAIEILNQKEYYASPIGEIARKAGVAKGTIYLYFKSKEELYFSILFMLMDKVWEMADEIQKKNIPASQKLPLFLKKHSDFIGRYRNIFLSVRQNLGSHEKKCQQELHIKFGELLNVIIKIIDEGIRKKEFKNYPSSSLAMLYLSFMFVNMHQKVDMHDKNKMMKIDITPKFIWDVFLGGIAK
ncbi:MAG: hypothetical protein A2539_09360 [Elusimicrobia bacterium RIFOXYD2_FULL_34_15]|nr:MAG: hypothetical protein A2539_09360 [Elusimicrobia bacterium RIFOXYD2_FULL_34_15]